MLSWFGKLVWQGGRSEQSNTQNGNVSHEDLEAGTSTQMDSLGSPPALPAPPQPFSSGPQEPPGSLTAFLTVTGGGPLGVLDIENDDVRGVGPGSQAVDSIDILRRRTWMPLPLGLRWERLGGRPELGQELQNSELEARLQRGKTSFSLQEWLSFGITDLRRDSFIQSNGVYYRPAAPPDEDNTQEGLAFEYLLSAPCEPQPSISAYSAGRTRGCSSIDDLAWFVLQRLLTTKGRKRQSDALR